MLRRRKYSLEAYQANHLLTLYSVGLGVPVPVDAIAKAIIMLASDNLSSHIHGQCLNVDGGKQGKVMYLPGDRS